ncbi:hypothetical protein MM239_10360 [Belliella sp. DSM 111904]|uniref:Secreted protein n=1 Tax=Belliella filtrata TaxID=2923435 RepID=A0ABS9V060_9BACT|nr:hypothetical protein [Belliella filtrata]MCH7409797.1 hypothetical protein [Belliella filtrata]
MKISTYFYQVCVLVLASMIKLLVQIALTITFRHDDIFIFTEHFSYNGSVQLKIDANDRIDHAIQHNQPRHKYNAKYSKHVLKHPSA